MFLNYAKTEATVTLSHNCVNANIATSLQQRIKTLGVPLSRFFSTSNCATQSEVAYSTASSNNSLKVTLGINAQRTLARIRYV